MAKVRYILTGGTIDKIQKAADEKPVFRFDSEAIIDNESVELDEEAYMEMFNRLSSPKARRTFYGQHFTVNSNAVIPQYLFNQLRVTEDQVYLQRLMMIDSWEIERDEREEILNAIVNSPEDRIVVTHGTSTMAETARFIQKFMDSKAGQDYRHKVVIFTGAMKPLSMSRSDAPANLGFAHSLAMNEGTKPGVHIAMHFTDFDDVYDVEKDHDNSLFYRSSDLNGHDYDKGINGKGDPEHGVLKPFRSEASPSSGAEPSNEGGDRGELKGRSKGLGGMSRHTPPRFMAGRKSGPKNGTNFGPDDDPDIDDGLQQHEM